MGSEAWAAEPSKYRLLTAAHMHVPRQKYKTLKKTKKEKNMPACVGRAVFDPRCHVVLFYFL